MLTRAHRNRLERLAKGTVAVSSDRELCLYDDLVRLGFATSESVGSEGVYGGYLYTRYRLTPRGREALTRTSRDPKALDKKALWREIDREERKRRKARVEALRADVRSAMLARRRAKANARRACLSDRLRARARARRIRERAKEQARALVERQRAACRTKKTAPKRVPVEDARAALRAERQHQRELRAIERSRKSRLIDLKKARPVSFRERRGESDDEVRANIDPSLHALFERVKRSIHASPRMSRTEAFMKYVEENPREADEAIEDKTETLIRELERRQRMGA